MRINSVIKSLSFIEYFIIRYFKILLNVTIRTSNQIESPQETKILVAWIISFGQATKITVKMYLKKSRPKGFH